jgi:ArsR family transcriptional regulator
MRLEELSLLASALSDTNRIEILRMLAGKELCACHILSYLGISQPTLSYHMKLLTESGLVSASRRGKWTFYEINRDRLNAFSLAVNEIPEETIEDIPDMDCTD